MIILEGMTYAMELLWRKEQTPISSGYIADIRRIMHLSLFYGHIIFDLKVIS